MVIVLHVVKVVLVTVNHVRLMIVLSVLLVAKIVHVASSIQIVHAVKVVLIVHVVNLTTKTAIAICIKKTSAQHWFFLC